MMRRLTFLLGAAASALGGAGAALKTLAPGTAAAGGGETFEVMRTEAEWRQRLTPEQFRVLRQHGTERSFSSPLNEEHRSGIFTCAGCELPLYRSEAKFESGTGWPSFTAPIEDAVRTSRDYSLILPRTEVHCRRCGGHLGHVFDDGPPPTGQRYCMNGVAMTFMPAAEGESS
jgi:peptide-methionine (R)-S-oxide reductase